MKERRISRAGFAISVLLPEGRFKELLRSRFWRRYDPLPALDRVIARRS